MNWASAFSFDQIWRSSSFPMWLTIIAAGCFAFIMLIVVLRTERSIVIGALSVITLASIGVAVASLMRTPEAAVRSVSTETRPSVAFAGSTLPAMACIEDLSGDVVGQACEKVVFASAESTAAAVNYASAMLSRLTALGDAATVQKTMSIEMQAMRRAIERDRYGLVAQVLLARDRCQPTQCAAYRSLTDNHYIITNMDEHTFDNMVARYAPAWNLPPVTSAGSPLAMMQPSMPTGKPTTAEFPSAANTPAVSIMSPEPGTGAKSPAAAAAAAAKESSPPPQPQQPRASSMQSIVPPSAPPPAAPTPAASKKQTAAKRGTTALPPPTPLSPAPQETPAAED